MRFWTGFWSFSPSYLWDEQLDVPNVFFCSAITLLMLRGVFRSWKNSREATVPTMLMPILFPLTYYLTHSSMDYRQPIEPEIVVMVALGLPRRFRLKAIGSRERKFFARTPKHTTREPEPAVLVSRA